MSHFSFALVFKANCIDTEYVQAHISTHVHRHTHSSIIPITYNIIVSEQSKKKSVYHVHTTRVFFSVNTFHISENYLTLELK